MAKLLNGGALVKKKISNSDSENTQIATMLTNWDSNKTKKNQIVIKYKNSNRDETLKPKLWPNQSMSQIRPNTQLEASKAPRWRIWVLDLKDIYPLVNISEPASKDPDLKSWVMFMFWTWSIKKKLTPQNYFYLPNKSIT